MQIKKTNSARWQLTHMRFIYGFIRNENHKIIIAIFKTNPTAFAKLCQFIITTRSINVFLRKYKTHIAGYCVFSFFFRNPFINNSLRHEHVLFIRVDIILYNIHIYWLYFVGATWTNTLKFWISLVFFRFLFYFILFD